jgi:hypothetical protein
VTGVVLLAAGGVLYQTNAQMFTPPPPAVTTSPSPGASPAPGPRYVASTPSVASATRDAAPAPTVANSQGTAMANSLATLSTVTVKTPANIRVSGEAGAAIVRVTRAGEKLIVFSRANGWLQVGPVGSDKPIGWIGAALTSPD